MFHFNIPLVNAHTHAAMVGFRGKAEDLAVKEWLEKYIWVMEKAKVNPDFVYSQAKLAIKEMWKNGIRVFNDMYFFEEEVARVAEELKMCAIIGEVILDFPTPSAKTPGDCLERVKNQLTKYRRNRYVKAAVAPHSIYALSEEVLIEAKKLAKKFNTTYHIHLAETKQEFDECMKKHEKTPVEYMDKLKLLDDKSVLAHCVWVNNDDIGLLAKRKANVVHCPLSNLKLGSGIAPIAKMLEKGVNVALGTDGAASSNRLDIWEAGKFAALLQKGITNDPTKLSANQAIEMMSINGMKALGIEKIDGRSIKDIKKQIESENFNYLYEKSAEEIDFTQI